MELINGMLLSSWLGREVTMPFDDDLYWTELQKRIASSQKKDTEDLLIDNTTSFGGTY